MRWFGDRCGAAWVQRTDHAIERVGHPTAEDVRGGIGDGAIGAVAGEARHEQRLGADGGAGGSRCSSAGDACDSRSIGAGVSPSGRVGGRVVDRALGTHLTDEITHRDTRGLDLTVGVDEPQGVLDFGEVGEFPGHVM